MPEVTAIPAFADNYIWMIVRGGSAVVVDPGDAAPVLEVLAQRRLRLAAILITHHHADHTGGIARLLKDQTVPVYGPRAEASHIPGLTHLLDDGDRIRLDALEQDYDILAVPGHTLGHIAYHTPGLLFCGDTLFSAGCGRLFEGTPEQMYASLSKLRGLPPETAVYCTHEYTLANLAFAAAVEPTNDNLAKETAHVRGLRADQQPSLPSNIGRECRINPFLRCSEPALIQAAESHAGHRLDSPVEVFATLRRWKDGFRAPAPV